MDISLTANESLAVTPDVLAGTPGQEHQNIKAMESKSKAIKYSRKNELVASDSFDEDQNDYGFNQRPQVKSINTPNDSSNDVLKEMQDELSQSIQVYNNIS